MAKHTTTISGEGWWVEVEIPTVEVAVTNEEGESRSHMVSVKTGEIIYAIRIMDKTKAGACIKHIMQGMLSMLTLFCASEPFDAQKEKQDSDNGNN